MIPEQIIRTIEDFLAPLPVPSVTATASRLKDPFRILLSTIISLRTKDKVTEAASERLFALGSTPHELAEYSSDKIATAVYPAGFYKNKSRQILAICRILLTEYKGCVPANREKLLKLPGVGIKTANLTLGLGFGIPCICVDTHVHRIPNRLGIIRTKTPEETEEALMKIVPQNLWIDINHILVIFGQRICRPVSPFCSQCPVQNECPAIGVERSR